MIKKGNIYTAEEGQWIVRLSDNKVMGTSIDLGTADSIDNYAERPYTQQEYDDFCTANGVQQPKNIDHKEE